MWAQSNQENLDQNEKDPVPFMNTMTSIVNKVVKEGYTDSFKVTKQGLYSSAKDRTYKPDDVQIINFYRFEGESDPADNSIIYVIETQDGVKGTLIDAYGPYADRAVNDFMDSVPELNKKNKQSEKDS